MKLLLERVALGEGLGPLALDPGKPLRESRYLLGLGLAPGRDSLFRKEQFLTMAVLPFSELLLKVLALRAGLSSLAL